MRPETDYHGQKMENKGSVKDGIPLKDQLKDEVALAKGRVPESPLQPITWGGVGDLGPAGC